MKRSEWIQKVLDEHIPNPEPALTHTSLFTLLVAVVLSAQCTDKAVNLVTPTLFTLADTPEKMARQKEEKVYGIIKRLGLAPKKSKALVLLSKMLVEQFQGSVPNTLEELITLPGVGRKTASVVLSQGFGIPAFPVDTHILRSAQRWGLSHGKNALQVEKDLVALFPKNTWIKLHLQIILFARTFCPAKNHRADKCPICSQIEAIPFT